MAIKDLLQNGFPRFVLSQYLLPFIVNFFQLGNLIRQKYCKLNVIQLLKAVEMNHNNANEKGARALSNEGTNKQTKKQTDT